MGAFQQFGLLLKKNALIRKRHPGILLLEVIWPILIVGIVAVIRVGVPPKETPTCHYQERSMPSAGLVPFLQTYVCNLNNKCHSEESRKTVQETAASVSKLVSEITPYLADDETLDALDVVDDSMVLIKSINNLVQDDELMDELQNAANIAKYFRDPGKVKALLIRDYNFSQEAVDALMASQVNLTAVLELTGYPDLKAVACDPNRLGQFLLFPEGTNVTSLSRALCEVNDSRIHEITDVLKRQLDVAEILRLLSMFESLKERLKIPDTWQRWLSDVADMLDLLLSIDDLTNTIKELAGITGLPNLLRHIPDWIHTLMESGSMVEPLAGLVDALDPLFAQFFPNDTMWQMVKAGMTFAPQVADLLRGGGNVTYAEFMEITAAFLRDVENIFNNMSPEVRQMLDAFSTMNWPKIWELVSSVSMNYTSLEPALRQIQMILEQTPLWGDISHYAAMGTDVLHSVNSFIKQLLDTNDNLLGLEGDEQLKQMLDTLMGKGPNITLAVLKTFTSPETLSVLLTEEPVFSEVCSDVMAAIASDIGQTTVEELNATLCYSSMTGFNSAFDQLGVGNITVAVNKTIWTIMDAVTGNAVYSPANFTVLAIEIEHLIENFNRMWNATDKTWAELLSLQDMFTELMDKHTYDWEPVLDMLNEHYLGSGALGLMRAIDGLMSNTQMQEMLRPGVHVASVVIRGLYNEMKTMEETFSRDSPMAQLVYYATNYAPELVETVMDMGSNGKMDMVYKLASSRDPLQTFCDEHMMQNMGLPAYVPLADMEQIVCNTNWTKVIVELGSMRTMIDVMVKEVTSAIDDLSNPSATYSFETDWRDLMDYSNLMVNMMLSEGNIATTMMGAGPWSLVIYANFTQVFKALDVAMNSLGSMGEDDMHNFAEVIVKALENIDEQMTENITVFGEGSIEGWRMFKHYVKISDDYNQLMSGYINVQEYSSLNKMLDMYPLEIRNMVELAAGAYLEFIDVLKRLILKPDQLLQKFVSGNIQVPSCGGTRVASILDLAPTSSFGHLEDTVCNMNWTAVALNMANQRPKIQAVSEDIALLMGDLAENKIDPEVNWTQVMENMFRTYNQYNSVFANMTWPSSFDLSPFNMTAINMKWADFVKDMDQLQQLDTESLMKVISELQTLLFSNMTGMLGMEDMNNTFLGVLQMQSYISHHVLMFINKQLHYINSSTEVNILDMLGSDELRKAAEVLHYSPEINAIGVNTLIRLFTDYSSSGMGRIISDPDQFMSLCSNLTFFSWVVAIDDSVIDTAVLQRTVCSLNIHFTVLMDELRQNWDGFADLVDSFSQITQPGASLFVDFTSLTEMAIEYSELLTSVINHPPTFTLFPDDEHWMNATLYEVEWKKFAQEMESVFQKYQDPEVSITGMVKGVMAGLAGVKEMQPVFYAMDASLDLLQRVLEELEKGPKSFEGFLNLRAIYSLLEQFPELFEMVAYTSVQHQEQVQTWGSAMTSWNTFCSTDPTTLMTAPTGSPLDIRDVFTRLCSINITQLMTELNSYQGFKRLQNVIEGGNMTEPVDLASLGGKVTTFIGYLENLTSSSPDMDINLHILNASVWEKVFARLGSNLNDTAQAYMSPAALFEMLMNLTSMFPELKGLEGTVKQMLAITDIILDQVLRSLQGGTLQELFDNYPTVKSVMDLTDNLPEIMETLVYTGLYASEKISANIGVFSSFESFCVADLSTVFTVPAEVDFDLAAWQTKLCAVNITLLLEELAEYQGTKEIENILQPNATFTVNMTAIAQKVEKVIERLTTFGVNEMDMTFGLRFLNTTVWEGFAKHMDNWVQQASSMWGTDITGIVMGFVAGMSGVEEMKSVLYAMDASLELVQHVLEDLEAGAESFDGFPNLQTMYSLLEQFPELFEMIAYTSIQHPEQVQRWGSAMTSLEAFCTTDPTTLMTAPRGSSLDVVDVFVRLCSINITNLMTELNSYPGFGKLQAVFEGGNMSAPVDLTSLEGKLTTFIGHVENLTSSSPDMGLSLHILNTSVWERVFKRLGSSLNDTAQASMSPFAFYKMLMNLTSVFPALKGLEGTMQQTIVITDFILDQVLRSLQGGTLEELFDNYPTVQTVIQLTDSLPEILETLAYTGLYSPEKISENIETFTSFESFCVADLSTVFTVPAEVNFDLAAWQTKLCAVNITLLLEELAEYQGIKEMEKIFQPNATFTVNLTAIAQKVKKVVERLTTLGVNEMDMTLGLRLLNTTVWEGFLARLEGWAQNSTAIWESPDHYIMLLNNPQLMQQLGVMHSWVAVSMVIMDKMLQYENETSFSLEELFVGAPELQKLVQLMEEPGVIEVLFESVNSPQFEPLLTTNNVTASFAMLCQPSASLPQYLTVPDGVSIDLVGIKSHLCALNPQLIEQEFMDFLDIGRFTAAVNGSIPVDWMEFMKQQQRVSAMITRWIESPPMFNLPTDWQNETFWLGILEHYAMQRQDPNKITAELRNFMEKISMMPGDPLHQVRLVMETVLRLINENVVALQNQSLTLDNMFQRLPILEQVMRALGIEGEVLNALRASPMKSIGLLIEAMLTNGSSAYHAVCDAQKIDDMLDLPPSFNMTALYQMVCLKNATDVVDNLVRNLDIQGLIDGLASQSAVTNWSVVFGQSEELQHNIENLIRNPPSFNVTSLLGMLQNNFNTNDLWQLASTFAPVFDALRQIPGFEVVDSTLKSTAVVMEFLDDLVNRLMVDGMTLNLASLFSQSPSFVRLVEALLHAQPDPLTALATIQLNPAKTLEFSSLAANADSLQSLLCSEREFREYFIITDVVNITEILQVLCTLNFTQFADELGENFMVDALIRKFSMAMNASVPFNMQSYIATYLNLVEHINTLTGIKNITFNGNNLEQAFTLKETLIMDALTSLAANLNEHYLDVIASSLDPLLNGMANTSEGQTVVLVFKILETYLHSLNQELGALMDGPITLAAIMNNTEAGKIAIPFLNSPDMLEELLNLQLLPQKLSDLFMEPNVVDALCGPELFTAFAPPSNESAALRQLQTSSCSANMSVMMWQAIMGQANGYQLYLQFGRLSEEVAAGRATVNSRAVSNEVNRLVAMVMQIAEEYKNGNRSVQDLLNWEGLSGVFERFQSSLTDRLMNLTQWSADLWSRLPNFEGKDFMARTINTANIFMEIINDRLRDVLNNSVSMSSLLGHSQTLINLFNAYMDVTQLSAQAWINGQFSMERLLKVSMNMTMMDEMCKASTLAAYLANSTTVPQIATTMQTVMCSLTTTLPEAFRGFIDYTAIQQQLETIWNMSLPVEAQFRRYQDNVQEFADLLTQLAENPPSVDPNLPGRFNFNSMFDAFLNIAQHPEMIFRLMKTLGIFIDGPLSTNDLENMFYGINAYVAQPILMVTERLNRAGLTLMAVMNDPSKLLEALPIMMDYSTQFEVLASVYLQPTMNVFWNNQEFREYHFCNGNLSDSVFTAAGLQPTIVNTLCQLPTTQWIRELQKQGASAMQIYTFVAKVQQAYYAIPRCYSRVDPSGGYSYVCVSHNADLMDEGSMNWMRLMTSLESLAKHLTPTDDQGNIHNMTDSMSRLWDIMQDAFLDKLLHSAMNYMEMQDRVMSDQAGQDWLMFKQFVRFLDSAGTFLNTYLHGTTGDPGMVTLESVLPDSEKVAALIQDIFGQASAAEVLTASVNPALFYDLAYSDRLEAIACDAERFSSMFLFEPGTNVLAIQQALCSAVRNRSTSLQELIDLFHAGDMLTQLDHLMSGDYSSMSGDHNIWSMMYSTVRELITNLEQVQQGNFNTTVSMSWFSPILDQLMALNQPSQSRLENMCENYVSFMGGTSWFNDSVDIMVLMTRVLEVSSSAAPFMPLMDDVACAIVTDDGLDLAAGVDILRQNGLDDFFNQLSQLMTNGSEGTFQCHVLVQSGMELYQVLNATLMSNDLEMERLGQCLQRGSPFFANIMAGINQIYHVLMDVVRLLDEEDFRALMSNSRGLGQVLEFILSILTRGQPVSLKFEDLLINSTNVEDYLRGILQLAPEAIDAILDSTIHLNSSAFLNNTVGEIAKVLCDPVALGEVMDLPQFSPVNIIQVSQFLCSGNVSITAAVFQDARQSLEYVSRLVSMLSTESTGMFMSNFTANIVDLFSQLQGMTTLANMFTDGFDLEYLRQNAAAIDRILVSGSVRRVIDSLVAIVGDLQFVVPKKDRYIITYIQTFIRGLVGLDFIQSRVLEAIRVSDLTKDVAGMRNYLINDLDFSPEVADALLNSVYSINVFLNVSGILLSDDPCETKLQQFLILNGTAALNAEITSNFCHLNTTQTTQLFEALTPELNIGDLVQKYVSYSGEKFLQSINMTKTRVKTVLEKLNKGGVVLGKVAQVINSKNGTRDPLLNDILSITGEFDAVVSLEPMLCGQTGSVGDKFNLDSSFDNSGYVDFTGNGGSEITIPSSGSGGSQAGTTTANPQSTSRTVYAQPDDFCRQLYGKVRSSRMGPIIMTYLKPIMSGKILYTPDTPTTRAIIQEANWVFDAISNVKNVSRLWSEKAPSLASLTDQVGKMDQLRDVVSNSFVQRILESTVGVSSQSLMDGLDAFNSNKMNASEIRSLQKVAELVFNYSSCLELKRFEPVESEARMEEWAWVLFKVNRFLGGIVFLDMPDDNSRQKRQADPSPSFPSHIKYKIRMDMDNVQSTHRIKERLWKPDAEDNFATDLRYMRGFLQLQDMIENAIVRLQAKDASFNSTAVLMQQMPFPCHTEDKYLHYLGSYLLPVVMTFAWLATLGIATHNLVYDRQNGQEESLRVMGMTSGLNIIAWLVFTLVIMAVVSFIITMIFKFGGVYTNSNWVIIFLYLLVFIFSTTMMCYFVSAFFTRVTLAILSVMIIYFISFLPFIVLISAEVQMTHWQKTLACLSSTTAFSFGAVFITRFEEETRGVQWSNVDEKISDSVSFSWMVYMMLIDSAIYLMLGWYIRNVKPGKYGRAQPWYFPLCPSFWCGSCKSSTEALSPPSRQKQGLFEPAPEGLDIGISVRGLRKEYGGKEEVVHSLDMDIYHDQVTSLLGHNGAAKTTTLNMLVGVTDPTDGVVRVEGKKVTGKTGLLGICPQHNALFEYMTVMEHMEFYSGVKGNMSFVERNREIRKLLHDVDLYHVKDVPAMELSGGMQRRLCVALAFVGGSKTIILDEPTSGVDPHARKNIWNLIIKNRIGRTILMSTHHLDEADMLSDRILIMHKGRLLCVGSPAFLKNQMGGGYKLTVNTFPAHDTQDEVQDGASKAAVAASAVVSAQHHKMMSFITSHIPGATFIESIGTDLTISLPQDGSESATLAHFFREFDAKADTLNVLGYGISNTTLEEVFLRVTTDADNGVDTDVRAHSTTSSTDTESTSTESESAGLRLPPRRPERSVRGASLKLQQLGALLLKRIHHYRRNWRSMISTLVLPLIAFLCAMGFATLRPMTQPMPSLLMSPALYSPTFAFFQDRSNMDLGWNFADRLTSADPGVGTTCMSGFDAGDRFKCVEPGTWAASSKKEQVCRCDDHSYKCEDGSALEDIQNIRSRPQVTLQDLTGKNLDQYLVDSFTNYIDQRFGGWSFEPPLQDGNTITSQVKIWFNSKGHHAIPSFFNAFSNNLLRTAVHPLNSSNYGITLYNHPIMLNKEQLSEESIEAAASDVGIAMVILLALSFIPSAFMVYLVNEKLSNERHIQTISGVGTVLYWIASFIWDLFVYSVMLGVMVIIVVIFKSEGFYDRQNLGAFALLIFLYGWAVIPAMYCTLRLFKSGSSAYLVLFCTNMFLGLITAIILFVLNLLSNLKQAYDVCQYVFLIFPQFNLGMGLVNLVTNQMQYKLLARFGEDTYVDPFSFEMLGWKFIALGIEGVVFFIAALIIHSRKARAQSMSSHMHYADKDDEDVCIEQERVQTAGSGDAMIVRDLSKVYLRGLKKFCAVNHISFGVNKGECFGLLGVNGAGKTTTFKMLTGGATPSHGQAIIHGKQLDDLSLREEVGYCPQEDALDMYLSGHETLHFHARLRGFDSKQAKQVVEEQLRRLHLESHADKAVHTYSGGTKRKLNLAIAMLGDPPVLLLDEPTTGMDAGTRRLAWKCITTATQQGQAVILTSHSMDECDSLCSRIAIMVNGQFKCLGSPQHLKNKFGDGYTVILHLQGLSSNRLSLADAFLTQFPGSVIKDQHHSVVEVSIPRGVGCVADIFAALQRAQADNQIQYYSVSQTTLDTIFVNFAQEQTDDGEHDFESGSSSGSSSGGSLSGKDSLLQKSLTGRTYAYMNPEFVGDPDDPLKTSVQPQSVENPPFVAFGNPVYSDQMFSTRL